MTTYHYGRMTAAVGGCIMAGACTFGALTLWADSLPEPTPGPAVSHAETVRYVVTPGPAPAPTLEPGALVLVPCEEEDSRECYWFADERGNGDGVSFVDINGVAYYAEQPATPAPDAGTDAGVGDARWIEYVAADDLAIAYGYGDDADAARGDLSDRLGCDADAPAALDAWGDGTFMAYCEPALAGE